MKGSEIKRLREECGLSREELAVAIGVTSPRIAQIESMYEWTPKYQRGKVEKPLSLWQRIKSFFSRHDTPTQGEVDDGPYFYLTTHGSDRLADRVGIKKSEQLEHIKRAWDTGHNPSETYVKYLTNNHKNASNEDIFYKIMFNNVYVFTVEDNKIGLITVFAHQVR